MSELRKLTLSDGRTLEYVIDRGRRKNIYIAVKNGRVVLKLPQNGDEARGVAFLKEKADWILRSIEKSSGSEAVPPVTYAEGESFTLAGEVYTVTCVPAGSYRPPRFTEGRLEISVREGYDGRYVASQAKKAIDGQTLAVIRESMERLSALTGLTPKKVTVKRMSASWGRCSSGGNISINANIVYYPRDCIDYVIIHELCHLVHMDHSVEFWALVGKYCPDWKNIRARLK
ncbi:MAG: M48 family metallopeptidase [Ruminococcus sp.]|nr:M48 family metallopeptidase [Ruminococcus sp.]